MSPAERAAHLTILHTHRWREIGRYGLRKIRIIYKCFCGAQGYSAP